MTQLSVWTTLVGLHVSDIIEFGPLVEEKISSEINVSDKWTDNGETSFLMTHKRLTCSGELRRKCRF